MSERGDHQDGDGTTSGPPARVRRPNAGRHVAYAHYHGPVHRARSTRARHKGHRRNTRA